MTSNQSDTANHATPDRSGTSLNIGDPGATEQLGRSLAVGVERESVDVVLVEDDVPSLVLGHVVARELGVRLVFAFDDGGLLDASGEIRSGWRAALLSGDTGQAAIAAVTSWLERQGATLAVILSPDGSSPTTPATGS